jgi:hypothetical protein
MCDLQMRRTSEKRNITAFLMKKRRRESIIKMNERFDTITSQLDTFASQLSDHTAMLAQILTKLDELN